MQIITRKQLKEYNQSDKSLSLEEFVKSKPKEVETKQTRNRKVNEDKGLLNG